MSAEPKDNGGPAFPECVAVTPAGDVAYGMAGMTLRDWFAGQALANIQGTNPNLPDSPASVSTFPNPSDLVKRQAAWAYLVADAMIAERQE